MASSKRRRSRSHGTPRPKGAIRRHGSVSRTRPTFKKGDRVFFEYHCFQSEHSADARLWHHTRQYATVIDVLHYPRVDRDNDPTYEVKFADGHIDEAQVDEVSRHPVPNPVKRGVVMPSCPSSCHNRGPL